MIDILGQMHVVDLNLRNFQVIKRFSYYIMKLGEERVFNGLADFSDLRKKNEDFNTISSKNTVSDYAAELDLENNEKIMKSFRELREKLKLANRENQHLREEMNTLQVELRQLHESENNLMSINHQLKDKNSQILISNDDLKKKIAMLKETVADRAQIQEEIAFLKAHLTDVKLLSDRLEAEKVKLIQMSVQEKLNLEEKLTKADLRNNSDQKYVADLESELGRTKEQNLKLQNELKKLEIKFDEDTFSKKWSKDNFEKEHYLKQISQLERQNSDLKTKNKKEREKRTDIEKRVLELEEISGMWNVKAEAFEGQAEIMGKKVKKMERRMSQAKFNVNKLANQKISWEEKFYKSVGIAEELINRVKRQLIGDAVELAKTCEFRINKLKESEIKPRESSIGKKNKTDKKNRKSNEKEFSTIAKYSQAGKKLNFDEVQVLGETVSNTRWTSNGDPKVIDSKTQLDLSKQNTDTAKQVQDIEVKIRREREAMEKKLKQRMAFRKIEVCSSPEKYKLREDYLKIYLK